MSRHPITRLIRRALKPMITPYVGDPTTLARCAVNPDDHVSLIEAVLPDDDRTPTVGVRITEGGGGSDLTVVLTLPDARAFAAGLLNCADEMDGLDPVDYTHPMRGDYIHPIHLRTTEEGDE